MFKQITSLTILILTLGFALNAYAADSLPDLTVTQFYVPARDTFAGSPYNGQDIRVNVENIGLGTAINGRLDLVITDTDGAAVCVGRGKNLGEMPGYDTHEYTFDRFEFLECPALAAGSYTLAAVVDRADAVAESNEDNNRQFTSVTAQEAAAGVALANLKAEVISLAGQQVKVSYQASQQTTNSNAQYAKESFYDDLGAFDTNSNMTSLDNKSFATTLTISPETPYRYRAIVGGSNIQTTSQIFILMKEAPPAVLNFTDLVEIKSLQDTSATISWQTTQTDIGTVAYEANNSSVDGAQANTVSADNAALNQSVTLTDLTPDTKYYFKITAGSGTTAVSFASFFKTQKAAYAPAAAAETQTPPEETAAPEETTPAEETTTPCDFATPGSLIKTAATSAVYYYGNDCKAYVFPNEKTYFTWYDNFSNVAVIPDASMAQISLGGNVTYRPGVKMIKMQSSPNVYVVSKGGVLHLIQSEAQAADLYGSDWNKKIDDVPPAFFTDYEVGTAVDSVGAFAPNTLKAESLNINQDKGL